VKEYLAMIVRTEEAAWFDRVGRRLVRRAPEADGILRSRVFPGLWLDAAALFRGDMRRVRRPDRTANESPPRNRGHPSGSLAGATHFSMLGGEASGSVAFSGSTAASMNGRADVTPGGAPP
jgi:hypothetical protein